MNYPLFSNALKLGVATIAGAVVAGSVMEAKPAQAVTLTGSFSDSLEFVPATFTGDFSFDTSSIVGNLVGWQSITLSNLKTNSPDPVINQTGWTFDFDTNFVFNLSTNLFQGTYSIQRSPDPLGGVQLVGIGGQTWDGPSGQTVTLNPPPPTSTDVPEPFTILGTGAAVGFSALFRREAAKKKAKAKAA